AGRVGAVRPSLSTLAREWPTPCAADSRRASGTFARGNPTLTGAAKESFWPTPTAADANASGSAAYSTESGRHAGTTLTDATARVATSTAGPRARTRSKDGMVLNPRFVEALLGFPDGFVALTPFDYSAIPSSGSKRLSRSKP